MDLAGKSNLTVNMISISVGSSNPFEKPIQVNGRRYYTHSHNTHLPIPPQEYLSITLLFLCWKTRMATLRSQLAFSSPVSQCTHQPRSLPAMMVSGAIHHSARSSFIGQPLRLSCSQLAPPPRKKSQKARLCIQMVKPTIQFIQGTDEQTVPDVRLTKSRDGTNGMAIFKFDEPSVFDSSGEVGDITGFYMIDVEGILQSVDVNARFVNGKPAGIEAKYVMRTPRDWDRFMRFMERYANSNGLQFVKS